MASMEISNNNVPELNIVLPKSKDIGKNVDKLQWSTLTSIDILLVTAVQCEFASCYFYLKNKRKSFHKDIGWVYFGEFGEGQVNAALVRCSNTGTGGVNSSVIVVQNAAVLLHPKAVIGVGFCGMLDPKKAKLGDVVISTHLKTHDPKKFTADGKVEWRGIKTNVSRNMNILILAATERWAAPLKKPKKFRKIEVHNQNAVMLSSSELVENLVRRQELLENHSDAIALEMQGEGVYIAAHDLGIEWAVVKGISDIIDESKTETGNWQPFASAMAASVLCNMFNDADVIESWPHYQEQRVQGGTSMAANA